MEIITVIKRNNISEIVSPTKITKRIRRAAEGLQHVDIDTIKDKTISGLKNNIKSTEIDELIAENSAYLSLLHPNYGRIAANIHLSKLHKETSSFVETVEKLFTYINPRTKQASPMISAKLYQIVKENSERIETEIKYERDYYFDYFGYKTLAYSYLMKIDSKIIERPQHMFMRVSLGIHFEDLEAAFETYHLLSEHWFIHASPTLFNAGTIQNQLSSCFLVHMKDDSIEGIYDTLKNCALISKSAGGIGLSLHNVRCSGSFIKGTNGFSNGLIPMLKVFNDTARYVDQGGAKRPGAFAMYLEPWHGDIFEFLSLRKNTGKEEIRARDLFYALWIPDLFMKRVENNEDWSLFCPNECPGLNKCYGEEFEKLYESYEKENKQTRKLKARELWFAILEAQTETGNPFMLYKDACNRKSNQKNLGTISSSNLCTEIIQYTSPEEIAVCNLASLSLPRFVDVENNSFDHQKLFEVTKILTRNLNKIIDINYYPIMEAKVSNLRHRPIGIGVQGLADVFCKLRIAFDSPEAQKLNVEIFETIYFSALTASNELAKRDGPYSTYEGSPISQGILQYDMWNVKPSKRWDWDNLKSEILNCGVRNSLLMAPMPTASTSQILGNNECFEPYTSNVYSRRVLSGDFPVINRYLVNDLVALNLWTAKIRNAILANGGSIQNIDSIPNNIKLLYKTVWEIKQKKIIDMAADRGAFIDQSQSLNLHLSEPTNSKITTLHFYAWKKGLKTGMYYLRSRPAVQAIQFTVDQTLLSESSSTSSPVPTPVKRQEKKTFQQPDPENFICYRNEGCVMCSG